MRDASSRRALASESSSSVSVAELSQSPASPSFLYQVKLWRWGLRIAAWFPPRILHVVAATLASVYARFRPKRFAVVRGNLLPISGGDERHAARLARALFREFGVKLIDLWRYEAGLPVDRLFHSLTGWENFTQAQARGKGVLLVTPHFGNWEFGAPLLASREVRLLVLTQAEPGAGFTEYRQAARARWGIETLVVGGDPFAFVEIIKRLQSGAVVALLIDRPPPTSSVEVTFFGRPFRASIAAAELARASGCAILPVILPRVSTGYEAHLLPEIAYDRRMLGNRDARAVLTGEILRAFEPTLRQHPDQWFHFVPVWDVGSP